MSAKERNPYDPPKRKIRFGRCLLYTSFRQTGDPSAKVFLEEDNHLLSAMEESERFRNMSLSGYVNQIDYRAEKQFSAVVIKVSEDLFFISYRGTDNTLVGWKEDFRCV